MYLLTKFYPNSNLNNYIHKNIVSAQIKDKITS